MASYPVRQLHMNRSVKIGAQGMYRPLGVRPLAIEKAVLYVVLSIVLMLVLSACRGGAAQQESKARKIPESSFVSEAKSIPAGTYTSDEFRPAMSLRLDKSWHNGP